jgi:hypothetical protein
MAAEAGGCPIGIDIGGGERIVLQQLDI